MIRRHTEGYNFVGDTKTGLTFRWGKTINENPFMAPWPELADISVSNYCTNNCEYCYRQSNSDGKFISIEDYTFLLDQLTSEEYGTVFQVALGGGEPLLHPDFIGILKITRKMYGIIPNYTTSGQFFNKDNIQASKNYCGAIAISYDPHRNDFSLGELFSIGSLLKKEKIKVNIHYVISEKSINNAIEIAEGKYDQFFNIFNAIIFLTYKPMGRANIKDALKSSDLLSSFLKSINNQKTRVKIGFDACFVPVLMKATKIDIDLLDSCECGFFSVYIDEHLNVMPCSFCNDNKYAFNLKEFEFKDIWLNKFSIYRDNVSNNCKVNCNKASDCRGKCPFFEELFLCAFMAVP